MKYITKYRPVNGEIKPPCVVLETLINGDKELFQVDTEEDIDLSNQQLVELFLCSYNIQVGDEFVIPDDYIIDHDLRFDDKGICTSINTENQVYHYVAKTTIGGTVHSGVFMKDKPYKIIGRISPKAKWVKEGMEFEDKSIHLTKLCKDTPDNWQYSCIHCGSKSDCKNNEGDIIKIKCSQCDTWH